MWIAAKFENDKKSEPVQVLLEEFGATAKPTEKNGKYTVRFSSQKGFKTFSCLTRNVQLVSLQNVLNRPKSICLPNKTEKKRRINNDLVPSPPSRSSLSLSRPNSRRFSELPFDMWECISALLFTIDIAMLSTTCKAINKVFKPMCKELENRHFFNIVSLKLVEDAPHTESKVVNPLTIHLKVNAIVDGTALTTDDWKHDNIHCIYTCNKNVMVAIHKTGLVQAYYISSKNWWQAHSAIPESRFWLDSGYRMIAFQPTECFNADLINKEFQSPFHCMLIDGKLVTVNHLRKYIREKVDDTVRIVYQPKTKTYSIEREGLHPSNTGLHPVSPARGCTPQKGTRGSLLNPPFRQV